MLVEVQEKLSPTSADLGMFILLDNIQGTASSDYTQVILDIQNESATREQDVRQRTTDFILRNKELFDKLAKL